MDKKHGNIDPAEALAEVNRFFDSSNKEEIIALAARFTPPYGADMTSDMRLSHHASEASWRLMTAETPEAGAEASRFALEFCERLDEAAAFIAGDEARESLTIGVQAKRMLVSQTAGLEPVLRQLVASSRYQELRRTLSAVVSSKGQVVPDSLEGARKFLATVSLVLDEAIL